MDRLLQDLRYALRQLTHSPGFTAIAVLSLAIGIGANTALFSVVNAIFIREYPFEEPDDLVRVFTAVRGRDPHGSTAYPDVLDMRAMEDVFSAVGTFDTFFSGVDLGDETVRVTGETLSQDLVSTLGIEAVVGRTFLPEEDEAPGTHAVVMLGHGFWERAFGADPAVVGQTIRLAGRPFTVVGVAPEWLQSVMTQSLEADVFVPEMMSAVTRLASEEGRFRNRGNRSRSIIARLAPGVTLETARARMDTLASQLQEAYPETNEGRSYRLLPAASVVINPDIDSVLASAAAFLMAVVGLVLLLACTNLASFLLARGTERRKEIAVRLALGARRFTLVRQLTTETLLISMLGAVAGLLVARWTLSLLMGFHPPMPVTFTLQFGIDRTVLLFTLGISALTGALFGLAPALQSTNPAVAPTLRDEAGTGRRRRLGLRNCLIALQVAVSVILLVGGGLFLRSLGAARSVEPGFSTREAALVYLDFSASGIPRTEYRSLTEAMLDRARALPGIEAVTATNDIPLAIGGNNDSYQIPGVEPPPGADYHRVSTYQVDPEYFETLGIPLLAGRSFTADDRQDAPSVVIVSEAAARSYWPGETAVGKQIFSASGQTSYEVVGVARDMKVHTLGESPQVLVYHPLVQRQPSDLYLVARGRVKPATIAGMLLQAVRETDPRILIMEAKTMEENVSVVLFPSQMAALLLGTLGVLALCLATIGLYGVVSFSVSRRTRELGIRMSLGADAGAVVALVLRSAMAVVVVGGLLGLAAAYGLAQLIGQFLVGIEPGDPTTLIGVPLLLGTVALLAAFVPARRASRVDPVDALRHE
jgi:predicted permease